MKILLAEDDKRLGNLLTTMLKRKEFKVTWVKEGNKAYEQTYLDNYDLLILDWMMPGQDGVSLCQTLREEGYDGKILLLTAKDSVENKITGLNSGADDYLVKPFEFTELVARINALTRRIGTYQQEEISYGILRFNRSSKKLMSTAGEIYLSQKEFEVLNLLLINKGQIIPREVLIDRIWGLDGEITTNNLDAHIKLLRKKISSITDKELIITIRGVGYKIEV